MWISVVEIWSWYNIIYWCDEKLSDSRLLINSSPGWTSTDSRKQLIPAEYKYPLLLNEAVQSAKRLNTKSPLARKDHLLDRDDDCRMWPFFIIAFFIVIIKLCSVEVYQHSTSSVDGTALHEQFPLMANRRRRSIAHGKFCGSTGSHIRQGDWWVLDECKVGLRSFTKPRDQ